MNNLDHQYQSLLKDILENGHRKADRTGTGTLSVFGRQIRHKMSDGFPVITTKKVFWRGVAEELLWFLRGETNIRPLVLKDINIWVGDAYKAFVKRDCNAYNRLLEDSLNDKSLPPMPDYVPMTQEKFIELIKTDEKFAKEYGELGPVYGKQWRKWEKYGYRGVQSGALDIGLITEAQYQAESHIDQVANLIADLRQNPDSRRLIVSAWNVPEVPNVVLPPCHYLFQCYTHELTLSDRVEWAATNVCGFDVLDLGLNGSNTLEDERDRMHALLTEDYDVPLRALTLKWNQRSVDSALGLPFNIASYGLLLTLLAKHVNMVPYELIGDLADTHVYLNQIEGVQEQILREPHKLPTLKVSDRKVEDLSEYSVDDFELIGYTSHAAIKMPLSN